MTPFSRRRLLDIAGSLTAASVLSALRPVRVAQAAEEKSTWNVKGLYMEACNCEAMCPCLVGNAPTPAYVGSFSATILNPAGKAMSRSID